MTSGEKIVAINPEVQALLDCDHNDSSEPAVVSLEKIRKYRAAATDAMRALTYYFASSDPNIRAAASEAINHAASVTLEPPPSHPPD